MRLAINKKIVFELKNLHTMLLYTMVGRKNGPSNIFMFESQETEYVTLNGKRDFSEIIKLRILN